MNVNDLTAQTRVYLQGIATPEISAAEQDLDQCRIHDMSERLVAVIEGATDEYTEAEERIGALFADKGDFFPFWKPIPEFDEDGAQESGGTMLLIGPPAEDDETQEVKVIDLGSTAFTAYAAAIGPVCALMLLTAARRPDLARMDFIGNLETLANRIEPDEQDWELSTDEQGNPFIVTWSDPEEIVLPSGHAIKDPRVGGTLYDREGFVVADPRVADHLVAFSPFKVLKMIAAIREVRS